MLVGAGIDATVWDVRVVSDPDPAMLADAAGHQLVVTVEDGIRQGGAGMFLAEALRALAARAARPRPCCISGIPRAFLAQGKPDRILADLGLDAQGGRRPRARGTLSTLGEPLSTYSATPAPSLPAARPASELPMTEPEPAGPTRQNRIKQHQAARDAVVVAAGIETCSTDLPDDDVQPRRPVRGGRRRLRRPRVPGRSRRATHLRRDGGTGQPARPLPRRPRDRPRRPRRHLRPQQRRVGGDGLGGLQAPRGVDQHQLPLRERRAPLPLHQRRSGGARVPGAVLAPGHRASSTSCPTCAWSSGIDDGTRRAPRRGHRPLRGGAGVGQPPSATSPLDRTTTTTSSTPAGPPACPKGSSGGTRTCSTHSVAASTRPPTPGSGARGDGREGPGRTA